MECTEAMLASAVKKAVERGLVTKYAIGAEAYLKDWSDVKAVVEAALAVAPQYANESALLARIQQLEERAAQAAELVAKAVEVMAPKEGR